MKNVLLVICLISAPLFAQEPLHQTATIEVEGTAVLDVVPDEIYISITLEERTNGRDPITVEAQENQLKQALTEIGVPVDQLSLSAANADYIYIGMRKRAVVSKTQYLLKVSDAKSVTDVFETLDSLKIDKAFISHVNHSKMEELQKQVKINAIKAAKQKADYLLEAISEKTGSAVHVQEIESRMTANEGRYINRKMDLEELQINEGASYDKIQRIEFRKITLSAKIQVIFEIKR